MQKPSTGTPGEPPQNRYKKFLTRTIIGTIMIAIFTLILNSGMGFFSFFFFFDCD
jgi:hypothetical protein